jgi:hypothetical protein
MFFHKEKLALEKFEIKFILISQVRTRTGRSRRLSTFLTVDDVTGETNEPIQISRTRNSMKAGTE